MGNSGTSENLQLHHWRRLLSSFLHSTSCALIETCPEQLSCVDEHLWVDRVPARTEPPRSVCTRLCGPGTAAPTGQDHIMVREAMHPFAPECFEPSAASRLLPATTAGGMISTITRPQQSTSRLLCKRVCCSQALRSPGEQASITFIPVFQAAKGLCAVVEAAHQTPSTLDLVQVPQLCSRVRHPQQGPPRVESVWEDMRTHLRPPSAW